MRFKHLAFAAGCESQPWVDPRVARNRGSHLSVDGKAGRLLKRALAVSRPGAAKRFRQGGRHAARSCSASSG